MSTTSLPVALQLSEQLNEIEILQSVADADTKDLDNQADKTNISSDVEVFKDNNEPSKANQEEQPVEEEDPPPDDEGPKDEETEAVAESDPVTEQAGEVPVETDEEAAAAAEAETATEAANNDEATAAQEAQDTTQPDDVTNGNGEAAGNDEADMPNDEPAKGDNVETPDMLTGDMEKKEISCFACASDEDAKCAIKATKEIKCPKANEGDTSKHNGCYTLYQADTNTTMRGCVDDLAEAGLKYCLKNDKLCNLCYTNGCNDKLAPSEATKLQLNNQTLAIFNIFALILIKCAGLRFSQF